MSISEFVSVESSWWSSVSLSELSLLQFHCFHQAYHQVMVFFVSEMLLEETAAWLFFFKCTMCFKFDTCSWQMSKVDDYWCTNSCAVECKILNHQYCKECRLINLHCKWFTLPPPASIREGLAMQNDDVHAISGKKLVWHRRTCCAAPGQPWWSSKGGKSNDWNSLAGWW